MKKAGLLLAFLCVAYNSTFAQFYLNLGMGYGVPLAGQTLDGTGTPYNGTRTTFANGDLNYNDKSASFMAGLQGTIGVGYMASNNIGFQLDMLIGLSTKKYTFNDDSINLGGSSGSIPGTESIVQQAQTPIVLMPSVIIQTGGDPINAYCRLGLALPLNSKITQDQVYSNYPGSGQVEIDDYTYNIKSSFSIGFSASAGLQYNLNDRIKIYGELSILSMSLFIKEADLTNLNSFTGSWQNVPLYAPYYTGTTVTKYTKNATVDSSYSQLPSYSQPFSNFAINVGVSFRLSEKKEHHSSKKIRSDNDRLREERDHFN